MFLYVTCIVKLTFPAALTLDTSLPSAFAISSGASIKMPLLSRKQPMNSRHELDVMELNIRITFLW